MSSGLLVVYTPQHRYIFIPQFCVMVFTGYPKQIQWRLIIMNCWGPEELILFTVRGIYYKCGKNVQCSIGLGSEGVFVIYVQNFNETPLYK